MNGDISWMYYTEINFLTRNYLTFFFSENVRKFIYLQISKILNTDTNRIFPIPFKVKYMFLRHL